MMSDISESPASVSDIPKLSCILEESEGFEISTTPTSPTASTVIAKFPSPGKTYVPYDPSQSLPSLPSHESPIVEVAEAGEEYFLFDKLMQENPSLSWAATVDDKKYDPLDLDQSLPSLLSHLPPTVEVVEAGEEYFSFDKLMQENPNLSWAATVEDKRYDLHDPARSLQLLPPCESPTVEVPGEEYFSFDKLIQKNPNLSWAAVYVEGEGGREEPVAATMSPSILPVMHPSQAAVTPHSDRSSSSDSLMRALLQPPPSTRLPELLKKTSPSLSGTSKDRSSSSDSLMRALLQPPPSTRLSELIKKTSPSLVSLPQASSKEEASHFQQPQELMDITSLGASSLLTEEATSPQRQSKRRRSELGSTSQSSSASENICTPPQLLDMHTGLRDLDTKSALFLARHLSPLTLQKPHVQQQQISTAIDPYAVGLATMNEVLRDGAMLTKELQRDARVMGRLRHKDPCVCNVTRHPSWWSVDRIQDVHNYSFLLDCQDLVLSRDTMVAANSTETIVVYDVPMDHNNPVKLKVEQVLRFIDVEVGFGDQTCDYLFYYLQPFDRKVLLVVSKRRVVGIVVAEKVLFAHRILRETASYMELEEDPVPVRIGINRLWVHISMRRKHLATILCRLIGNCLYENETLYVEDYAFNNISDAMVMFAKVFLKTLRPPLY